MKTIEAEIAAYIERLKRETGSDFAILGLIDTGKRKLRWSKASGSISERTPLVEQKSTAGLSGTAIRSGRTASTSSAMTDTVRFKLGEPILLTEQLRIAASVPIATPKGICGVLLMGRRSEQTYVAEELEKASHITVELSSMLV